MSIVFEFIKLIAIQVLGSVGVIVLIGFILGIMEKVINKNLLRAFGRNGVAITAIIGTPVHEIGHMIMCLIFAHKIKEVRLLNISKNNNGVFGYVSHSYNKANVYQRIGNFFIAVGPIFSGILAIFASMYFLLPESYKLFLEYLSSDSYNVGIKNDIALSVFEGVKVLMLNIFKHDNLSNPYFWIFVFITGSISSHIALSKADIEGAKDGFIVFVLLLVFINLIASITNIDTYSYFSEVSKFSIFLVALSAVAVAFSAITLIISTVLSWIFARS